ncbi:hypothetical protein PPYR_13612 [Photinus pyralis]|uniref:Uncharacterized protein n=1 Tax=Photinus pyralis TaxID=7054 RepID=A0A1Y1M084_PHOPY|nr:hypothetical protein PPYR_13612 [Photinus pyralis]
MCHEKRFASCCFCVNLKNACTIIALIHILTSFLLLASDENSFQASDLKRLREFGCIACIGLGALFLYEVIIEKREAILVYGYFYMLVVLLTCFELFFMAADGVEGFSRRIKDQYTYPPETNRLFYSRAGCLLVSVPFNLYFIAVILSFGAELKMEQISV